MKNHKRTIAIISFVICLIAPVSLLSQDAPPPPPPGEHGQSENQEGGRAPIGGGMLILIGMGGVYGGYKGWKLYQDKKKKLID